MKINRGRELGASSERRTDTFTGEVWGDPVLSGNGDVVINNIFFAPGGRTHWHRHEGVQILCVVGGRGHAYTRDGEGGDIRAGDIVYVPAHEEHWHGADADSYLLHTAITFGRHDWLEAVTDEEYASAGKQATISE
jgi:quercetin dioxygenase-like cupin family protein